VFAEWMQSRDNSLEMRTVCARTPWHMTLNMLTHQLKRSVNEGLSLREGFKYFLEKYLKIIFKS
jgi:hypothetical protein